MTPWATHQEVHVAQGCQTSTIFLGELQRRGALGEASNLPLVVILLQRPKFRQPQGPQGTPLCPGVWDTRNCLHLYQPGSDGGSVGTQIFSEQIVMCVGQQICRCGFFNVAIYPEDWEGSNNYLEGWNLLTASIDYNVSSPYLWAERHSPNPFPSRPINLLLLLSFTSCDSTETLTERVQQRVNQSSIHAIKSIA